MDKMKRTCRFISVCLVAALFLCLFSSCALSADGLIKSTSFEGGTAYRTADDIYWVLDLKGTWREMGRQYGALVKHDLQAFYAEITSDIERRGMSMQDQLFVARGFSGDLSEDLVDLLDGMAETSGLTGDEVRLLNAGMFSLSGLLLGQPSTDACSGIGAWGSYTPGGKLVFGRNWDMMRDGMLEYMKYLSVVVFHPDEGIAYANMHPLGNIYVETGINEDGLFLELNNGMYSDENTYEDREISVSVLADVLTTCRTIDEAAAYLAEIPAEAAYIIQLADAERAVSVERATFDCRVRAGDEKGLLVTYNSFVPPYPEAWEGKVAPPRPHTDDGRYDNLVNLANSERFYGELNAAAMKELMDIQYEDGGATHKGTVLQVIAAPEDLSLWMRGYEYSDWQAVDLKPLFANE